MTEGIHDKLVLHVPRKILLPDVTILGVEDSADLVSVTDHVIWSWRSQGPSTNLSRQMLQVRSRRYNTSKSRKHKFGEGVAMARSLSSPSYSVPRWW
jgi:hypothetical protein